MTTQDSAKIAALLKAKGLRAEAITSRLCQRADGTRFWRLRHACCGSIFARVEST